jgi:hypothetical protein
MSEAEIGGRARGAIRDENGNGDALGATDWICLAATPTFAIMALLTAVPDGGSPDSCVRPQLARRSAEWSRCTC